MAMIWLKLSVYILSAITTILVILETFTCSYIGALKLDNHKILTFLLDTFWYVDFMVHKNVCLVICDRGSVDLKRLNSLAPIVDE
jgi:hypothetical protein